MPFAFLSLRGIKGGFLTYLWKKVTNNVACNLPVHTFGQHHKDCIIASYCAKEERMPYVVNIISHNAGMSWRRVYHHQVTGKVESPLCPVNLLKRGRWFKLSFAG